MTRINIEKIAQLANLDLTEEEKHTFQAQFDAILDHVEVLSKAPVDLSAQEEIHTGSRLRDDQAIPSPVTPESFSPYLENHHFKVPRVIE